VRAWVRLLRSMAGPAVSFQVSSFNSVDAATGKRTMVVMSGVLDCTSTYLPKYTL